MQSHDVPKRPRRPPIPPLPHRPLAFATPANLPSTFRPFRPVCPQSPPRKRHSICLVAAVSSQDVSPSPNLLPSSNVLPKLDNSDNPRPRRKQTDETRRKISFTMMGKPKSDEMRKKVSEKLKGRVPWNKGKKLSPETRARMSAAHFGRVAWNKGRPLSDTHKIAISQTAVNKPRALSDDTKARMRMARRRPGDAVLSGSAGGVSRESIGSYSLLDGADINAYVSLRRELRVWSDTFVCHNARRPTLADVRRVAPVALVRKFEQYVSMREQIRGLASDVYGDVNPNDVPAVHSSVVANSPVNNSETKIVETKHGNKRIVSRTGEHGAESIGFNSGNHSLKGSVDDMWDMYDRPASLDRSPTIEAENMLIGTHELLSTAQEDLKKPDQPLSPNDFRKIGCYRLMETMDINHFMDLRRELQSWSQSFKKSHGRTPSLTDAKETGKAWLYRKFCEYLEMRDRMNGLVTEVYGTGVDNMEVIQKVNDQGKEALEVLERNK